MNRKGASVRELANLESIRGQPQYQAITACLRDGGEWEVPAITDVVEEHCYGINRIAVLK